MSDPRRPAISSDLSVAAPDGHRVATGAWLVVAILGVAGFVLLAGLVATQTRIPFDQPLLDLARGWDRYFDLWNLLSNAANVPMIGLGAGIVLWTFWKRRQQEGILVIVVLAAVTAGSQVVKQLVARPRPPGSDTVVPGVAYSFPSGHVLEAVTILGMIAIVVWRSSLPLSARRAFAIAVAIFVAMVAVARVAVNAHYPSDVLAGFLAGIAVLAIFGRLTAPADDGPWTPPQLAAAPMAWSTVRMAIGVVGVIICLTILGSVARDVRDHEANALDAIATPLLHSFASPGLDTVMRAVTFLGSTTTLLPVFVLGFLCLVWLRRRRDALFLTVAIGGSVALEGTMKLFFARPRPTLPWAQVLPDHSFPSGHSMNSIVLYVALALLVWQIRGRPTGLVAVAVALVLSLMIGISRIYLGYHYFTDVLGGFLAGALWLFVVIAAFSGGPRWVGRHSRPTP